VEVFGELEDLSFELSSVSEVEIGLCRTGVTASVNGAVGCVYMNVTYLEGV
jgi:hypothetical protein